MALGKSVEVFIHGDAKQAINEIKRLGGTVEAESSTMASKMNAFGKTAALAVGGAAIAIGAFSVKMADSFEKSHARLQTAVTNSGHKLDEYTTALKNTNKEAEKFGFNNTQSEDSLARLTTATGDFNKAAGLQEVVMDVSRQRGIDLMTATQLVTKAYQGNAGALRRLGIDSAFASGNQAAQAKAQQKLSDLTEKAFFITQAYNAGQLKGKDAAAQVEKANAAVAAQQEKVNTAVSTGGDLIALLAQKYGGAASKYSETLAGKTEALKAQLTDLAIKIGTALVPILEKLVTWISDAVDWFEKHKTVAEGLAIALGALVAAYTALKVISVVAVLITATTVAMGGAAVATEGLTAAELAAAPAAGGLAASTAAATGALTGFLLPAAAVAAAAYGIYKGFTDPPVWIDITRLSLDKLSDEALPKAAARLAIVQKFTGDATATTKGFNEALSESPQRALIFAEAVFKATGNAKQFADMLAQIPGFKSITFETPGLSNAVNLSNILLTNLGKAQQTAPGVQGHVQTNIFTGEKTFVPNTATGGIVTRPQIRMVGEAGPEAIIPLNKAGGFGGTTVIVNVQGSVVTEKELVRTVSEGIRKLTARSGSQGF